MLKRFEDELFEEEVVATPYPWKLTSLTRIQTFFVRWHESGGQERTQEEENLDNWEAEIFSQQDRWSQALKLVLKFRTKEHQRMEIRVANTIDRLLNSATLPPELLIKIVRHVVVSQVSRWNVDETHDIDALTDKLFLWPDNVPDNFREILKQTAVDILFKESIIRIPSELTSLYTLTLPQVLKTNEHHIRRLVVDIVTLPRNNGYSRETTRAMRSIMRSMSSLASTFTKLTVCVFLLHNRNVGQEFRFRFSTNFGEDVLELRNLNHVKRCVTWETILVDSIAVFARSGPGKRKLIRFSHNVRSDPDCRRAGNELRSFGPLVEIGGGAWTDEPSENEMARKEDLAFTRAKRIFDQSYRGPRVERDLWTGAWS